jgi:PAS domain S-box-containing protein/putative nucleotidyltransferase with HDIG domain
MQALASSPLDLPQIAMSLDALACGAVLINRSGIIAHANARLGDLIGRQPADLVGVALPSLYPAGETCEVVRTVLRDFDRPRSAEFYLPLSSGDRLPVIFSARPVGNGSVLSDFAVVTLIDISSQKQAEQRLLDQNAHIGRLNQEVREYAEQLEQRVQRRTAQLHEAHMETIYMLAIASEVKDEDTGSHVRRVRRLSQALANRMGISSADSEKIGLSSVLHDVGKIHTPDGVLKKPGPLTPQERGTMQEHTLAGERILQISPYFEQAGQIARNHHENWDGSGYPHGLRGEEIPLEARIVHVVDVFDALTHTRVYKPAWEKSRVIEELRKNRGAMFDPKVVDVFLSMDDKVLSDAIGAPAL